ncbi:MAG TPA: LptF/LptG family permease [Gemmatimonadaceae bacterium]|nr:LptF/LptG family permease [Gemmatimonadaceae bacterium]
MKILSRYVLKEHLGPLTFALTALTSLLLLNYIAKQFGNLVGKGIPWSAVAEFFLLSIPFTVALTLPMAVLVATLHAFSRLAAENEITALKASGVSLKSLMTPVLIAAAGVTLFMIIFNDQILPRTNHQLAVLQSDIAQKKPTFALREQVINEVSPGKLFLRANHLDEASNLMRDVTIYDLSDATRRRTIYADSGNMALAKNQSDLLLTLYHGSMQDVPVLNPSQLQRLFFNVDLVTVKGVANQFQKSTDAQNKGNREMSVCEMQREVRRGRADYMEARKDFLAGMKQARDNHVKLGADMYARIHTCRRTYPWARRIAGF